MSTAVVILFLLGFAICVIVGLVTLLQGLINPDSIGNRSRSTLLQDSSAER